LTHKRRYVRETAQTYEAAEIALTKLQRQVDDDRHPKTAITVRQAIAQWFEVAELADTTRERYQDLIRLYLLPVFGETQAARLDAELLERFYARLRHCRSLCSGRPAAGHVCRPLSGSTTRKIHYIIRGALGRAVRWRYLGVNKAAMAVAPSPNATEPDPPSAEEAAAILNEAWTDPEWGLLLWLTMVTGCRRGELCALVWADVDVEQAVLRLPASIAHTKAGLKRKPTKTNKGRRVALDPHTVALLIDHRQRWEQRCAMLGCELTRENYLFSPAPDGSTPFVPRSVTQRYRRMATKLRLRSTRLHSLRHYSATELIAAGVDVRTVAGRLGHGSGGATTLKVYAAWVDQADRRAATTMADIMPTPILTPRAPRGPYEQIAAELRQAIVTGALEPGSRLPTVVEIAAKHRVAAGTAHRAIASLRSDGLIEVSRGRRATVRASHGPSPQH
jgi:integrase